MAAPQDYFQRIDLTDGDTMMDRSGDNVREDFMDAIYNIAPTLTPFMSGIGRATSKDVYTSWQQDDLAEPNSANAAKDGADLGADSSVKARRVGNINQISTKSLIVSGRANAVDKAGRSSEMNYQLAKAAKALKRDQEAILTGNQAALPDADGNTASLLGGLRACLRNAIVASGEETTALVNTGSTGANGGVNPGTTYVPAAATDAAVTRALTETLLRSSIEACYINGGSPDTIMVSPTMKTVLSTYLFTSSARVAALYSDVGQKRSDGGATAQGAVDIYISDFGALMISPNRYMGYNTAAHAPRNRDLFVLDMTLWAVMYLRPYRTVEVARSGDSDKRLLLVDYSLQYKQEMGSGGVFDIDSTAAMTP